MYMTRILFPRHVIAPAAIDTNTRVSLTRYLYDMLLLYPNRYMWRTYVRVLRPLWSNTGERRTDAGEAHN